MKIVPLFLKDAVEQGGIGLTNEQYGLVYGTFGTVAFIIGSISAGYYVSRFGLKKVLFSLVCMFNIPFAVYLLFAVFQPQQISVIALGIVGEYFGYGFGFVGLTLFMMQQIARGEISDGPLCVCQQPDESGRDVAGNDKRLSERSGRI